MAVRGLLRDMISRATCNECFRNANRTFFVVAFGHTVEHEQVKEEPPIAPPTPNSAQLLSTCDGRQSEVPQRAGRLPNGIAYMLIPVPPFFLSATIALGAN